MASCADAGDADAHTAIVDQQVMSGQHGREYLGMVQRDRHGVAVLPVGNETDFIAGGDGDLAILDRADPDLRALQILENANRAPQFGFKSADRRMNLRVVLMGPMTEVEPERVDFGKKQLLQHVGR